MRRPRYFFEDMGMEIERKWLPRGNAYQELIRAEDVTRIEQGYLSTDPVIRVRKDGDRYYLTYKGKGLLEREEYNLPLKKEAYDTMIGKCEGRVIRKNRARVPLSCGLTLEIDEFLGDLSPLVLFEVEFPDRKTAERFDPPDFFGEEVTEEVRYTNAYLSSAGIDVSEIL